MLLSIALLRAPLQQDRRTLCPFYHNSYTTELGNMLLNHRLAYLDRAMSQNHFGHSLFLDIYYYCFMKVQQIIFTKTHYE